MFCAPSRILVLITALETSDSAVNGGQTTISTSLMFASSRLRPFTRSSASATVLFIFQFPATINLRALSTVQSSVSEFRIRAAALATYDGPTLQMLAGSTTERSFVRQRHHAGQHLPFEKFEAGAPAGAHKRYLVRQTGHV